MSGRRRWFGIGLAVAAVPAVVWVVLQGPPSAPDRPGLGPHAEVTPAPTPPTPRLLRVPPVEVVRTAITTADAQGRRQWDLRAASVVVSGGEVAALTGVEGTYFRDGEPAVSFAAPRGTFHVKTRTVTLTGGVSATTESGQTLRAHVIRWVPGEQRLEASGQVVLRQAGVEMRADRLFADPTLRRARLDGNVRVSVAE